MSLEAVLREITMKGNEEVKKIEEEAKKEVEKIILEAKTEAETLLKKAKEEAEKEGEALRKQEISSLNLEMKRLMLAKQKKITDEVFTLLKQKIVDMDEKTRKSILKAIIEKNAKHNMKLYVRKEDEKIVKEILKELKLSLKIAGNISVLGGIVLEDPGGEVRINLTFDELLIQLYEKRLNEVAKVLFG
ncbi:MAG: V-type ATP synthase subunit E family protein [Archaeoglobaceae archaeon]|nr:V-type ATP synthase subunit E family protein [Archaeoglobaceae archaeon]MDW7989410.1 V-type ATP synthase subunit E family protein [Archaeoglobaceae archaeon]